jgi:hypothetical protein
MRFARGLSGLMLAGAALALAACASSKSTPDLAPATPTAPISSAPAAPAAPLPVGTSLSAGDISRALSERKFTYAAPGRKGTVTFFNDGTFEYDEAGKGTGTGIWQASNGKLCEARNPTGFLPKGTPSVCNPITSDGSKLTAGALQLIPL